MVVLTAINLFCKKWLHKENYCFEEQMNLSSRRSTGNTENILASTPSEYWFLGFKDRDLEEEYLNDLVIASKGRLYLGYSMCALLVFTLDLVPVVLAIILGQDPTEDRINSEILGLYGTVFVVFIAGLIFR